jgi:hypothetical protein
MSHDGIDWIENLTGTFSMQLAEEGDYCLCLRQDNVSTPHSHVTLRVFSSPSAPPPSPPTPSPPPPTPPPPSPNPLHD